MYEITIQKKGAKVEGSLVFDGKKYTIDADAEDYLNNETTRKRILNACMGRIFTNLARKKGLKWDDEFTNDHEHLIQINNLT